MEIGMLWFDNDPLASLIKKVEKAAAYYREKYGKAPNRCYVHPDMLSEGTVKLVGEVELVGNKSVRPNHFWLGFEEGGA